MVSPLIELTHCEMMNESPRIEKRGDSFVDSSKQDEFYQHFGQRLKTEREKVQMTQDEVARQAGIDRSYLSQIESGKRRVSLYVACRLAQVFGKMIEVCVD